MNNKIKLRTFEKEEKNMPKAKLLFDEKYVPAAAALIKAAKKEILVMAYLMTAPGGKKPGREELLYAELLGGMRRGLDCKIIINHTTPENKMIKENIKASKYMKIRGVDCRAVSRNRTVHAKMIIIDGVSLIVGSHNWTRRAMERNIEASIQVDMTEVVKIARERFLELWEKAEEV